MPDQLASTCQTCLRPLLPEGVKQRTQWVSVCRCQRPYLPTSQFSVDVCAQCFRRVAVSTAPAPSGGQPCPDICTCAAPSPIKVPTFLKQNASDALNLDPASQGLNADSFPQERFKPIALLGNSTTAITLLARDKQRGTKVVVKCLKQSTPAVQAKFQSEVKKNQLLTHATIAKIVDAGIQNGKAPYLVMEYKDGFNLEQCLALHGFPSYDIVVRILISICQTLVYSEKQGVLHRNIKPGNIIFFDDMNAEPTITVTDFALPTVKPSQQINDVRDALYMSADEARGVEYTEKSEIYMIGCIGFALLTGRPPFQNGSLQEIKNDHALKLPPQVSNLRFDNAGPRELYEIIERCLEKDPSYRFDSLQQLLERLEVFPRREEMQKAAVVAARKRKKLLSIAAIVLIIAAVSGLGLLAIHPH